MTLPMKTLVLSALGLALAACQAPSSSEAQSLRERIQDRAAERRAERGSGGIEAAGGESVTITVDGRSRSFIVAAPPSGRASSAVLVFHGGNGTAEGMFEANSLGRLAIENGFVAAFPDAFDRNWNDGRAATANEPDDVAFTRAMIDTLNQRYGVDRSRVFATGISNGAMMTHKLACDAPGLVRAIAPVAGNLPEAQLARCAPSQPTPVMMFSGTADPLMPFDGGVIGEGSSALIRSIANSENDQIASAPETAAFWARVNGCAGVSETPLADTANDGTTVVRQSYECPAGAQVTLYRIEGGGHTWPGSTADAPRISGTTSRDIDASGTILGFFRGYGL